MKKATERTQGSIPNLSDLLSSFLNASNLTLQKQGTQEGWETGIVEAELQNDWLQDRLRSEKDYNKGKLESHIFFVRKSGSG